MATILAFRMRRCRITGAAAAHNRRGRCPASDSAAPPEFTRSLTETSTTECVAMRHNSTAFLAFLVSAAMFVSLGCENEEERRARLDRLEAERARAEADSIARARAEQAAEAASDLRAALVPVLDPQKASHELGNLIYGEADTASYKAVMDSARGALRAYYRPLLSRQLSRVPELPSFVAHYERYDGDYYNHRFGGMPLTARMILTLDSLKEASWTVDRWGTEGEVQKWRRLGEHTGYYQNAKHISHNVTRGAAELAANLSAAAAMGRMKAEFHRNMRESERIRAEKARRTPAQRDSIRREINCLAGASTGC